MVLVKLAIVVFEMLLSDLMRIPHLPREQPAKRLGRLHLIAFLIEAAIALWEFLLRDLREKPVQRVTFLLKVFNRHEVSHGQS